MIAYGVCRGMAMPSRLRRIKSLDEAQANVRRAKEMLERYGLGEAHPDDYMTINDGEALIWEQLLNKLK